MKETSGFTIEKVVSQAVLLGYDAEGVRDYIGISAISKCPRQLYRQFTRREKKDVPLGVLMAFLIGKATHESIQSLLWEHRGKLPMKYRKAEREIKMATPGGRTLRGHCDLVAELDGVEMAVDFKTQKGAAFRLTSAARDQDVLQASLYAVGLGLGHWSILYLNKDDGEMRAFVGEVDQKLVSEALEKYDGLMAAIEAGIEPQCPFTNGNGWQCDSRYCDYREECWPPKVYEAAGAASVEINADDEYEYAELLDTIEKLTEAADNIREKIETALAGRKGTGLLFTATYSPPSETRAFDKKRLEALVPTDILERCVNIGTRKGGYRFMPMKVK